MGCLKDSNAIDVHGDRVDVKFCAVGWDSENPFDIQCSIVEEGRYTGAFRSIKSWISERDGNTRDIVHALNTYAIPRSRAMRCDMPQTGQVTVVSFSQELVNNVHICGGKKFWKITVTSKVYKAEDVPRIDHTGWHVYSRVR